MAVFVFICAVVSQARQLMKAKHIIVQFKYTLLFKSSIGLLLFSKVALHGLEVTVMTLNVYVFNKCCFQVSRNSKLTTIWLWI